MNTVHLFTASITPILLISACGLVAPALYSRLGEILARIRSFHQQKIELLKNLNEHDPDEQQMLLGMLDSQIEAVVVKAKMIKKALYCLLAAIAALLLCSVCVEAASLHEWVGSVALALGFLGLSFFFVGLGWAMWELSLSLTPVEEERAILETLTAHYLAKAQGGTALKIAKAG